MIESRLLPDQIHNFAHNNEWMVRNLLHLGRVKDAIRQSKNLLAMPRHPTYNTYAKGSYRYGRERLLQTYRSYGLWDELISDALGPYYAAEDDLEATDERDAWLAVAQFMVGNRKEGGRRLRSLQRTSLELRKQILDAADLASADSPEPKGEEDGQGKSVETASADKPVNVDELKRRVKRLGRLTARVAAAAAAVRGDAAAVEKHAKLADLDRLMQSQWLARAKNLEAAQKLAEDVVRGSRGEVLPLAVLTHILWQRDNKEEAKKRFEELRKVAHSADLDTPVLAAVAPVAVAAGVEGDWRIELPPAGDVGERPPLEELGPETWRPFMAEPLIITTPEGVEINGDAWEGKPRIIIFYLGAGCLHCVEQLQTFAPRLDEFRAAGIDVFAISNEKTELLKKGLELFDSPMPIPLYSDPEQMTFMAYRCWDDFESVPLHGTFLEDAQGRVRWHDIGSNPFTDVDFLLSESKRLLSLPE
jgi:peroxiredoxin